MFFEHLTKTKQTETCILRTDKLKTGQTQVGLTSNRTDKGQMRIISREVWQTTRLFRIIFVKPSLTQCHMQVSTVLLFFSLIIVCKTCRAERKTGLDHVG